MVKIYERKTEQTEGWSEDSDQSNERWIKPIRDQVPPIDGCYTDKLEASKL